MTRLDVQSWGHELMASCTHNYRSELRITRGDHFEQMYAEFSNIKMRSFYFLRHYVS